MKFCKKIILASASPRRKELLSSLGCAFDMVTSGADEIEGGCRPSSVVMKNARAKAEAVVKDGVIVAADTVVYLNGKFFLKPKSAEDAFSMLKELNGKTHFVYTGVCVRDGGKTVLFYDKSAVKMKKLSDVEIKKYIESESPLDKAGAYGIQDNVVVETYCGSYTNIIGLPMEKLERVLGGFASAEG